MLNAWTKLWRALRGAGGVPGGDSATRRLGERGEREAAAFLKRAGFRILDRNVVVPMGEADLVAESPEGAIVIVEVKSREVGDARHPPPEAQVDQRKRRKLRAILAYLTAANGWEGRARRIDVVAVDWREGRATAVRHYVGVGG